jgi:CRISPR/Cas system-associated exonuclease Cas4 (RecB family)
MAAWMALEAKRDCAWWEWMTRWARAEVALATAAAILALVAGNLTNAWSSDARSVIVPAVTEAAMPGESLGTSRVDSVVTRSLAVGASSDQVMNALVGPASGEWLLTADVAR